MITNMISWYCLDYDSKKNGFYQSNQTDQNTKVMEIVTQIKPIVVYIKQAPSLTNPFKNI